MNDAIPVRPATRRSRRHGASAPRVSTRRASVNDATRAGSGSRPGAMSQTIAARARLSAPAAWIVPGSPSRSIITNPLASTPTAAPRLFVK